MDAAPTHGKAISCLSLDAGGRPELCCVRRAPLPRVTPFRLHARDSPGISDNLLQLGNGGRRIGRPNPTIQQRCVKMACRARISTVPPRPAAGEREVA